MTNLEIRDLLNLVASKVPDPESRLEKVFECAHARHLEIAKWLLAFAAALYAAIAVAAFKGELSANVSPLWAVITFAVATAIGGSGLMMLIRGKRVYRIYLAAQSLLGEITKIAPFIERYRSEAQQP